MMVAAVAVLLASSLAPATSSAWGRKYVYPCGFQSQVESQSGLQPWASTYALNGCLDVRVRERRSTGGYGSWQYNSYGYIKISVSSQAVGGSHGYFNEYDQWVSYST